MVLFPAAPGSANRRNALRRNGLAQERDQQRALGAEIHVLAERVAKQRADLRAFARVLRSEVPDREQRALAAAPIPTPSP